MPTATVDTWLDQNQQQLSAAIERLKRLLTGADIDLFEERPPVLANLAERLDLSPFEQAILLLCAAVELDRSFGGQLAEISGQGTPTFGLALAALPQAHWSALTPAAPLRYWRLVELQPGALTEAPLRIDERILHALTGMRYVDEQLQGFVTPLTTPPAEVPSQVKVAEEIVRSWQRDLEVVQLSGPSLYDQLSITARVARKVGMHAYRLDALILPTTPNERELLTRLWQREAILSNNLLLLDCHHLDQDTARRQAARYTITNVRTPLIIATPERLPDIERASRTFDVSLPRTAEQRQLWQAALVGYPAGLNGQLERLTAQFSLNQPQIEAAARHASGGPREDLEARLWQASRIQARPQLDDLAQRIESAVSWDDLVLPAPEMATLHDIAVHLRQRMPRLRDLGFRP